MRTEIFLPSGDRLILPAEMSRIGESGNPLAEPSTMAVHLNRRTHSKSTLVPIKPVYRRSGRRVCACAADHRVSAELCMNGLLYAGALARVHPKPSHTSAGIAANSVTYPAIGAKGGRIVGHTSADRSGSVEFGLRHHTSSGRSTPASDGCELTWQHRIKPFGYANVIGASSSHRTKAMGSRALTFGTKPFRVRVHHICELQGAHAAEHVGAGAAVCLREGLAECPHVFSCKATRHYRMSWHIC